MIHNTITGSEKKYYLHCINNIFSNGAIYIISSNSSQMTYNDLAQWLYNNDFSNSSKRYSFGHTGEYVESGGNIIRNRGYFSDNGTDVYWFYEENVPAVDLQAGTISYTQAYANQIYSSGDFTDKVIEL